jgi:hypothetical protein
MRVYNCWKAWKLGGLDAGRPGAKRQDFVLVSHLDTPAAKLPGVTASQPPAIKTAGQIEKETDEHRTLNVQYRIMYSANLN